jgi:CubicO group peptidase (beta-lactamase class C family)
MRILKRVGITLVGLVMALAVLASGVYVWAAASTGTSLVARGIMWGDTDVDDWQRFPPRVVHASPEPVIFEAANPVWLDDLKIDEKPLVAYLEETHTTAFIILHGDELLYEGYFNGSSREATQTSVSVAKSFASTLVAIAIEEGYIASLDDPVTTYIPELLEQDTRFGNITLRHLLTMSSGIGYHRNSNPLHDGTKTYYAPDLRALALESRIEEPPGTRFLYNDYNPLLIGMVLERATNMSVSEYLETRLWQPMGAEADGSWSLDSDRSGFEKMNTGVNGRAIDFAKLGWLFLHGGKAGDRQVVPQAWVEQVARATDAIYTARADHAYYYQNYWWLDVENDAYYAEGNLCQFIYVYPAADLVLVRHGRDCGGTYWTGLLGEIAQWLEPRLAE